MRVAYSHFGDVVSFDTTYRKNKHCRPFAMFVGVNHHKQTIIFGAALLYDETSDTFEWLFDTFIRAMDGKKPKTILTDQDAAMAYALKNQWPETSHRLCIWHLYQNAAKHLSGVFEQFREFSKDLNRCVYDYEEEGEFLQAWNEMLQKYALHDNDWLKRMFNVKEKWALVYGRDTFCADMTTTQLSESMNNSLKGYVSYKHDVPKFFHHFQRLVEQRRYEELKADFKATQSSVSISLNIAILKHAAIVYTPQAFTAFQIELGKAYDCELATSLCTETVEEYKVKPLGKFSYHTVRYDTTNGVVKCSCKKFEFAGILCSHVLKVLSSKNIMKVPEQYILKRWTKLAKSGTSAKSMYESGATNEDPKTCIARRYKELCRLQTQITTRGSEVEEAYNIVSRGFTKILEDLDASMAQRVQCCTSTIMPNYNGSNIIHGAGRVKGIKHKERVRGNSMRPKGGLEKGKKKKKSVKTQQPQVSPTSIELTSTLPTSQIESHVNIGDLTMTSSFLELLGHVDRHNSAPSCLQFGTQGFIAQSGQH